MNLTFKTVSQDSFKLSVDPTETVLEVKKRIEQEKGHAYSSQKLIYSGKILHDSKTIDSYGVTEKGFIVLMVPRARTPATPKQADKKKEATSPQGPVPVNTAPAAPPTAAVAQAPTTQNAALEAAASSSTATTSTTSTTASSQSQDRGDSDLLVGSKLEEAKDRLVGMGFIESEVRRALKASFNNPERAVEYLTTGIPEGIDMASEDHDTAQTSNPSSQNSEAFQEATATAASLANWDVPQTGDHPTEDVYRALEDHEHFRYLRSLVQARPDMLPELLDHIRTQFPQFWRVVNYNPRGFVTLLTRGLPAEGEGEEGAMGEDEDEDEFGILEEDEEDEEREGLHGASGLQQQTIRITQEEGEAIARLQELGFTRQDAVLAYLACDKNEELAANYLFEHMDDM
ncbi:MAG: hypothetical protein DHS80DRAFT_32899 [Piptocephalis tieghemiana]|nr:MAG: hypothetical protein DHS80DRAFT_32899 [Piptocephalis tieghemiana]